MRNKMMKTVHALGERGDRTINAGSMGAMLDVVRAA